MVVTEGRSAPAPSAGELKVIWHDLECGGYRADLPLWRELATAAGSDGAAPGPILEIGSGSGRVALDLAAAGHSLVALDIDGDLVDALSARAAGTSVEVVRADARTFDLGRHEFSLCLAPMQTVQLLGGSAGRAEFLSRARAHLRPGGLLACAIVTDFECFDCTQDEAGPTPETVVLDGRTYVSRPLRVSADDDRMLIERERSVRDTGQETPPQRDLIELDLVTVRQLEREALDAGLRPAAPRRIAATDEHLASDVVMLRA
ncbi:MAG TPA: class I SAM-dependent methyltransferase [Solirubrobacteraceae bacterium]|jgi:SAM-dependent methyltransferase|nr:class I SAM-dependent methyltransferase [Solirubrobacteraceae bacterium]